MPLTGIVKTGETISSAQCPEAQRRRDMSLVSIISCIQRGGGSQNGTATDTRAHIMKK